MALDLSALDDGSPSMVGKSQVAPQAPLSAFEEDPDNPRFEEEGPEFDGFVESVRAHGILQPVVAKLMASGRLRICFGRRRYRAARYLQLATLPYVVTEDPRQLDDYAQVEENERRKQLQPLELATFIARKLALGARKKEVAARLGIDASAVTHLLALVGDVPSPLLELYHSGRCRTPQYLYELRGLWERNADAVVFTLATVAEVDRKMLDRLRTTIPPAGRELAPAGATGKVMVAAAGAIPPSQQVAANHAGRTGVAALPVLKARHAGRDVVLCLARRPSAADLAWVREDGAVADEEVPIGQLRLTGIVFEGA